MTIFIIVILYFILYRIVSNKLEIIGSTYYNGRIEKNKTTPKIYDIAHKYLPDLNQYDMLHHLITIIFVIPIMFNWNMLNEYLGYWVVIFLIRTITIIVTILPKYKHCKEYDEITMFLGGCYDKIFSGHFSSVFLATLLYLKYGWITMPSLVIINLINSLSILLSRGHYTIDLIVAIFVTLFVYQNNLTF
jgi:hypothetical protein